MSSENSKLEVWKGKQVSKNYLHFDERVSINKVWFLIKNRGYVSSHAFLPFIHYQQKFIKFSKKKGKKEKIREIYYCGHLDRHLYALYSYKLNQLYNRRAKFLGIDDCSVAYRTNKKQSTIDFAKRAFQGILSCKSCLIFVGDFTNFFDNLKHDYLKSQLLTFTTKDQLPNDYYAVFKSITKYSYIDQKDIANKIGIPTRKNQGLYDPKRRKIFNTAKEFRLFKKEKSKKIVKRNPNDYGIPQGSPMSAVLSNIYMMDFDVAMKKFVQEKEGWYFRYSDDFIVILPCTDFKNQQPQIVCEIKKFVKQIPSLVLQPDKCKSFFYSAQNNSLFELLESELVPSKVMSYLGFSFDGKVIRIRDKTIGKYYYRAYGKANSLKRQLKAGERKGRNELYRLYTLKGVNGKRDLKTGKYTGNFLTYMRNVGKSFESLPFRETVTSRHYGKLKRHLRR